MVDFHNSTVCCMCGDVGFPDKLFRCNKCLNRFQHSYCSNFYSEYSEAIELCDWCQSEERSSRQSGSSSSSSKKSVEGATSRSAYTGDHKIKQHDHSHSHSHKEAEIIERGPKGSGVPSPRQTTRRYKLLKDVMC